MPTAQRAEGAPVTRTQPSVVPVEMHRAVAAYAIDDQTATKVTDDGVEVISEGHWRQSDTDPVISWRIDDDFGQAHQNGR
jgi:hypothetical protein